MEAAKPKGRADCRLSIGAAVELLKTAGQLPAGLEQCDAFDLDRHSPDLPVLGAPNGVIDLNTGQLLPREEGRKRFVSRSIPDEFQPDAQHKMVDDLIAHVPEAEREYLLAAVGFALRRIPARRMYLLVGKKRSGKTTLLNAVYGCLGDVKNNGYGMSLDVQDLAPPRWNTPNSHSGGLFGIQDAAIAIVSEAPQEDKVTFNERLIRSATGGDVLNMRDVGEKSGPGRPASATMVMALNPDQLPGISLRDEALRDRLKIMDYPPLALADADVDPMRLETVRDSPAVRQALLALLVKACAETKGRPPQDTDTVTAAVEKRYAESIGQVGEWLIGNVSRSHGKRLYTKDLWAAVVAEFGPEEDGKIEERTRRETIDLLRTVIGGLPPLASKGRKSHYLGLTLAPAPADDADDWPLCKVCAVRPVTPTKDSSICGLECLEKVELVPLRPSSPSIDDNRFIVATVGEDSAVVHAHFCDGKKGWVHEGAEIGLEPMDCERAAKTTFPNTTSHHPAKAVYWASTGHITRKRSAGACEVWMPNPHLPTPCLTCGRRRRWMRLAEAGSKSATVADLGLPPRSVWTMPPRSITSSAVRPKPGQLQPHTRCTWGQAHAMQPVSPLPMLQPALSFGEQGPGFQGRANGVPLTNPKARDGVEGRK